MTSLKDFRKLHANDLSLFRKIYIIALYFCNVSFLQIPAYALVAVLFLWGVKLVYNKQQTNNTFFKLRFGLWVWGFLFCSLLTMLINFEYTIFISFIMMLHILICFFIFYGIHTEENFDFKKEIYSVAKLIVYITTVLNIIGIVCIMTNFTFEWHWIKFTIYENRFTGVFINPNLLGFISCASLFCCHIFTKSEFSNSVDCKSIEKVWIFVCFATSLFSLLLCDSNASLVLLITYCITYIVYDFFSLKEGLNIKVVILKIISVLLICSFFTFSTILFRDICQRGFAEITSTTYSILDTINKSFDEVVDTNIDPNNENNENNENKTNVDNNENSNDNTNTKLDPKKDTVTFKHENKNIDSGRFKLYKESVNLFKLSPIFGISNGNIVFYSQEYANGVLSYSYHNSDLHNGFLTILVSTGVIGFLIFCIFGFRFAKHSAQHLFLQNKTYKNDIYPCLFSFLTAYLFYSMFEKALLYDISFMVMWFWLLMGYMSCYVAKFEPMLETQYLFHQKRLKRTLL